ncbi:hypothetical protein ACFU7Y_06420 [Kitasatospora sp. NPDC057542]|uniref:hypothetical protein n=1 Tax=Kitasatospora sp. NPDC057542 TaxID=3346162 RepID=UPI003692BE59
MPSSSHAVTDEPSGYDTDVRIARGENLRHDAQDWLDPVGRVLDPGFGRTAPTVPLVARIEAVAATTGLPVALLDTAVAPHRIRALTGLVGGLVRYTGTETRYRDGREVAVRWPEPWDEPPAMEETRQAVGSCRLFEDGLLIVDGAQVPATVYRPVRGGAAMTWAAEVGGWFVSVRGPAHDGTRVHLVGADRKPGPGRPRHDGAS